MIEPADGHGPLPDPGSFPASTPPPAFPPPVPARRPVRAVSPELASFGATLRALTPRGFVTEALVAANVLVFAVMVVRGVSLMDPKITDLLAWGAGYGPRTTGGEPWRLFTAMFLHIGLFHLAMNMYAFWAAGRLVERLLGNAGFLVAYLVAGLTGSMASVLWNPYVVSAGASGAIFGVYGALVGFLLRERRSVPPEALRSLGRGAMIFVGLNLMIGMKIKGIDMAAHVGGLAGGFVSGLVLAHPLTPAGARLRWLRTTLLAAVTAVALTLGVRSLRPQVDVQAVIEQIDPVEERYNHAVEEAQAGRMTSRDFADEIETRIVPDYDAVRTRLADAKGLPPGQAKRVEAFAAYMRVREDAFRMTAEAARKDDPEAMKRAVQKQREADRLLKDMGK